MNFTWKDFQLLKSATHSANEAVKLPRCPPELSTGCERALVRTTKPSPLHSPEPIVSSLDKTLSNARQGLEEGTVLKLDLVGDSMKRTGICVLKETVLEKCSVPEGSGFCQSTIGRRCESDGKYFEGTGPPWPCIGPNDVQCCVKNEDINTGSSTSVPPSTTSSTTSSLPFTTSSIPSTTAKPPISNTPTPTLTPTNSQSPSPASVGLSSGAKGGIAGGVVAGVLIMGLIAALFFVLGKQRNAKRVASTTDNARPPTPTAAEKRQEENAMTEKDDDTYGKPEFLGGSPLSELPAEPLAGELDSQAKGERSEVNSVKGILSTAQIRSRAAVELSTNT
ncbi:hypothetical protein EMPG_14169 [Blastomyces silverae]|uniref:Uncharacterized protein n=1 Tax=Blastomyces silverae TaxID=2060906 RepID=A0A0H1BG37_9EURO|nr:hypothetical protein EMPG_14169 [Blastomyces silverae]